MLNNLEENLKEKMHFHYMTYMAMPYHNNLFPGVMKFMILVDRFCSSLLYTDFNLSDLCLGVEKKIFQEIHKFYTFLLLGCGIMKFTIFCLFTLQMPQNKLGKDWHSS